MRRGSVSRKNGAVRTSCNIRMVGSMRFDRLEGLKHRPMLFSLARAFEAGPNEYRDGHGVPLEACFHFWQVRNGLTTENYSYVGAENSLERHHGLQRVFEMWQAGRIHAIGLPGHHHPW